MVCRHQTDTEPQNEKSVYSDAIMHKLDCTDSALRVMPVCGNNRLTNKQFSINQQSRVFQDVDLHLT